MRYIGMILLGLLIGAFATVAVLNALGQATAFPRGVMAVSGHHMGGLRAAATATPCQLDDAARHLRALAVLADDIEPAFLPDGQQDATFSQYALQHRTLLAGLANAPPADCEALGLRLGDVGDSCKACHRDYK